MTQAPDTTTNIINTTTGSSSISRRDTQLVLDGLTKPAIHMSSPATTASSASLLPPSAYVPGGESGYEPYYPNNTPTDSSVKRFIRHFFEVSDDEDRNDEWVGFFAEDATVIMGADVAKGSHEIRKLRRRMWRDIEARKHRVAKVFPGWFSADPVAVASLHETELMLFGAVAYRMRESHTDAVASWAAHGKLHRDGVSAPWKFEFYRVYIQR